jgi:hypothetical protein
MKYLTLIPALLLFVGCATTDYEAFYRAQDNFNQRQSRPLVIVEAQPGETVMLAGVARIAVYQPMEDQAPIQWRRQPGAVENVLTAALPATVVGTAAYLGIREQGRTSRFNSEQATIRDIALYDIFASQQSGPTFDLGQVFDGSAELLRAQSASNQGTIAGMTNFVSALPLQEQTQILPIDLNPQPTP